MRSTHNNGDSIHTLHCTHLSEVENAPVGQVQVRLDALQQTRGSLLQAQLWWKTGKRESYI